MKFSAPIFRLKREARLLSRSKGIPLARALDDVAKQEGFKSWSLLVSTASKQSAGQSLYEQLVPGDLVLLGARPGHGKTLLGLEVLMEAVRKGRQGVFFTLEYTLSDVANRLRELGENPESLGDDFICDTSNDISAAHIVSQLENAAAGTVVVVDYLQLLDQKRTHPDLDEQISDLKQFARQRQLIMLFISQIDRSFDSTGAGLPTLADIRLPNPMDLSLFSKACFLQEGSITLNPVA